MAEIRIEKKKPVWPWILGLVILAAIIAYFVFVNDDTPAEQTTEEMTTTDTTVNNSIGSESEITEYVSYVNNPEMGLDHEYSSGAITRLVDATRATAEALNVDTEANLSKAKEQADDITKDPMSLNHANKIKSAAESITGALKTIQTEKFPHLQAQYNDVEMAVGKIVTATPTLEQKDAVNMFFNNAATLLTNIKNDYEQER